MSVSGAVGICQIQNCGGSNGTEHKHETESTTPGAPDPTLNPKP